jgi:hypothetical protein
MSDAPNDQPHWSIPHVIGVLAAVAVYLAIFAYSGDSDLLIAIATGAVSMLGSWVYLFSGLVPRKK